jgi:cytochrome oxidase Cu insertion factor (SCO1/SenC/PrrC family)
VNKPASSKLRGQRPATGRPWWRYLVLAAVLVAIVAFVIVNRNSLTSAPGSAAPGATPGDRGLPVGAAAPLISLQSTNGATVSLDQLRGSKVVVYFYESSG